MGRYHKSRKRNQASLALRKRWKRQKAETTTNSVPQDVPDKITNNNNWGTDEDVQSIMDHELCIEQDTKNETKEVLFGKRIVDINYLVSTTLSVQYTHMLKCTFGKLEIVEENNHGCGLFSKITLRCLICNKIFIINTENPGKNKSLINTEFVWGSVCAGSTYSQSKDILSALDIPVMSEKMYLRIENSLEQVWYESLLTSMEEAGKEEYQLAIKDENIPSITVYVDGGWSKRSYGHSYNALSGVAVIIGKASGKALFLGVRNKYCCICARAERINEEPAAHMCYRNWSGSSSAMEADIIVEGFNHSISTHGVKYTKFIADGDSSVFARIKERVTYGKEVEKVECANHAIKNYGKALYKIKSDVTVSAVGRKLLTVGKIKELQKTCKKILRHHKGQDVEILKLSLQHGPFHVFNDHVHCEQYYCKESGQASASNKDMQILQGTGTFIHIQGALETLLRKAHKLIEYETNNKAEVFMSLLAKFNCGKRLNLVQRGAFQRRAYLAGLRYNEGQNWQANAWAKHFGTEIGKYWSKHIMMCRRRTIAKKLSTIKRRPITIRKKHIDPDYGKNSDDILSVTEITSECLRIMQSLQV